MGRKIILISNNDCVSAVVGVILMVAIVVSVAAVIYFYTNEATESKVNALDISSIY